MNYNLELIHCTWNAYRANGTVRLSTVSLMANGTDPLGAFQLVHFTDFTFLANLRLERNVVQFTQKAIRQRDQKIEKVTDT